MTTRKRRASDDEIEREAIEKSADPEAWEAMPPSQPSRAPRPAWMSRDRHLELAAEFHVLSVLHRLGIEANLALAQADNVDIAVLGAGGQAITLDVKVVRAKRPWQIEHFNARKHHYIVFVEFAADDISAHPNAYIVPSEKFRRFVSHQKLEAVPVDVLRNEFSAAEAWHLIASEQAA